MATRFSLPLVVAASTFAVCLPLKAQSSVIRSAANATEVVRPMINPGKGLAWTSDGRLWALILYNDGKKLAKDASRHLYLYASGDGGKTWKNVADTRTNGDSWGSLVTGPDGRTLHVAWQASDGKPNPSRTGAYLQSIYYASFDTRKDTWNGSKDSLLVAATSDRAQFYRPDVECTESGNIAVVFYHRYSVPPGWVGGAGSWNGGLLWNKGKGWSKPHRVNVDTYGPDIDVTAEGEMLHFAYRTATGGYGTRYRSFDLVTEKFGKEIQIPSPTKSGAINGNINMVALTPTGDVYITYCRRESSPRMGEIRVAYMKKGSGKFTTDTLLAKDSKITAGNSSDYHYTLGVSGSQVFAIYSIEAESWANLYMRVLLGANGASPQLRIVQGKANQFQYVGAHRRTTGQFTRGIFAFDYSVPGGSAVYWGAPSGAAVLHGAGCQGKLSTAPDLAATGVPGLGQSLTLALSRHPASAPGILFLGLGDQVLGAIPLPLPLGALGMNGCVLTQDIFASQAYSASTGGSANLRIPLPNDPKLKGVPIYWQSFVLAKGANQAGAVLSNGLSTIAR